MRQKPAGTGLSTVRKYRLAVPLAAVAVPALVLAAQPSTDESSAASPDTNPLPVVTVVGYTPVAGADIPPFKLPYFIQSAEADALARSQTLGLADFLSRNLAGVTLNQAQNNPLQPDLQFRGFTATPLLGGSEGLAVYVDGVRVNEVFGDTVNWDLIADAAIERMSLLSGANPVFGLNAIGGALSLQTKTGFSAPGTRAEYYGGSFGRNKATLETGGHTGVWGWYVTGSYFDEEGWRDLSPSRAANAYGTLSWQGSNAQVDLHAGRARTRLTGNGPVPVEELAERRDAIFTAPDQTGNALTSLSVQASMSLAPTHKLSATLYRRRVNTRSFNGDATDAEGCEFNAAILCDEEGEPQVDQQGEPLSSEFDAINNVGHRRQTADGGAVQMSIADPVGGLENQLALGAEFYRGRLRFDSAVEATFFQDDRRTVAGTGVFIPEAALAVQSRTRSAGIYLTDTLSLSARLALTVSGRWNRTRIAIDDATGENPDLDGRHSFSRVNPAAGVTYQWNPHINFYGGYSESTRAPTPVELTCSDEDAPCKLPNQFLADPPLNQVVARSWELGIRGLLESGAASRTTWHAGLFTTTNSEDILFQVTGGASSNEGFFANAGNTRRRGFETSLETAAFDERLHAYANYTFLEATYRTAFLEVSANHPDASDEGFIAVQRGDRIPGLPQHALKVGADYEMANRLTVGGDLVRNSGQYLRSDEANRLAPIAGFTVLNLRAVYAFSRHVSLFGRVDNVFDRHYATFGTLGEPAEIFPQFEDPRFLSPSQPRAGWVGVRVDLGPHSDR